MFPMDQSELKGGDKATTEAAGRPVSGCPPGETFTLECEFVPENEKDDLAFRLKSCRKNPGHHDFIDVSEFSINNLPPIHRTRRMLDEVFKRCAMTVRVMAKYTSKDRPDVFSDEVTPYPFAICKGSRRVKRYGTGRVINIFSRRVLKFYSSKYEDDDIDNDDDVERGRGKGEEEVEEGKGRGREGRPCPCPLCQSSNSPHRDYWWIRVRTATHVIYDRSEAEGAEFDCFYDSESRDNVKTIYGYDTFNITSKSNRKHQSDVCDVLCVTHDKEIVRILSTIAPPDNFLSRPCASSSFAPSKIVVSHPHGGRKKISVGEMLHLTVPVNPDYPVQVPIAFKHGTVYRQPLMDMGNRGEGGGEKESVGDGGGEKGSVGDGGGGEKGSVGDGGGGEKGSVGDGGGGAERENEHREGEQEREDDVKGEGENDGGGRECGGGKEREKGGRGGKEEEKRNCTGKSFKRGDCKDVKYDDKRTEDRFLDKPQGGDISDRSIVAVDVEKNPEIQFPENMYASNTKKDDENEIESGEKKLVFIDKKTSFEDNEEDYVDEVITVQPYNIKERFETMKLSENNHFDIEINIDCDDIIEDNPAAKSRSTIFSSINNSRNLSKADYLEEVYLLFLKDQFFMFLFTCAVQDRKRMNSALTFDQQVRQAFNDVSRVFLRTGSQATSCVLVDTSTPDDQCSFSTTETNVDGKRAENDLVSSEDAKYASAKIQCTADNCSTNDFKDDFMNDDYKDKNITKKDLELERLTTDYDLTDNTGVKKAQDGKSSKNKCKCLQEMSREKIDKAQIETKQSEIKDELKKDVSCLGDEMYNKFSRLQFWINLMKNSEEEYYGYRLAKLRNPNAKCPSIVASLFEEYMGIMEDVSKEAREKNEEFGENALPEIIERSLLVCAKVFTEFEEMTEDDVQESGLDDSYDGIKGFVDDNGNESNRKDGGQCLREGKKQEELILKGKKAEMMDEDTINSLSISNKEGVKEEVNEKRAEDGRDDERCLNFVSGERDKDKRINNGACLNYKEDEECEKDENVTASTQCLKLSKTSAENDIDTDERNDEVSEKDEEKIKVKKGDAVELVNKESRTVTETSTEKVVQGSASKHTKSGVVSSKQELMVPMGSTFTLPVDAPFVFRIYNTSPGWISFPVGTVMTSPVANKEDSDSGEVTHSDTMTTATTTTTTTTLIGEPQFEFKFPSMQPEMSYVTYDISTCPGSSGATVFCDILGKFMVIYFPHSGCDNKVNRSGVRDNFYTLYSKLFLFSSRSLGGKRETTLKAPNRPGIITGSKPLLSKLNEALKRTIYKEK